VRRPLVSTLSIVAALLLARVASADGKRDLEDGIAFYENLDNERALERLKAASVAKDLDAAARAKAFLYLGMLEFETGDKGEAQKAWKQAFQLKRSIEIPSGTSPKTIEAIEAVRATVPEPGAGTAGGGGVEPGGAKKPTEGTAKTEGGSKPSGGGGAGGTGAGAGTAGGAKTVGEGGAKAAGGSETPEVHEAPSGNAATNPLVPPPAESDDSTTTWLIVGGIGAAVIGAAVVIFLLTRGGDCKEGGGCLTINFN
jgi:tetratricopeptide (TPR) repeat protein